MVGPLRQPSGKPGFTEERIQLLIENVADYAITTLRDSDGNHVGFAKVTTRIATSRT